MNTIELLKNTNISYYGNVKYNKPYKTITLYDWIVFYSVANKDKIYRVREQYNIDKKIAKKMKAANLPCVTITATFGEYRRMDKAININPILAIDIDYDDNLQIDNWDELKYKVASLPYVFLTSYSCSGKGLYCLVYIDKDKDITKIFNSLRDDFSQMNINIDKNCRDITRLRFVSYDDNILIKQDDVEMYSKELENQYTSINYKIENNEASSINETDDFIYKSIYHLIDKCNYRANDYSSWLQDGFRLATFGEYGYILFMLLSMKSDNYNEYDAKHKFNECQKSTRYTKTSLVYYFGILKKHYGKNWKEIIRQN